MRDQSSFRSGVPGMGSRPLGDHRDAPLVGRAKVAYYLLVVLLVVLGLVGVVTSR